MTHRTSTGFTPYRLVYRKACHLPIELEHKALWALKTCNFDVVDASKYRLWQLNKLEEWHNQAYGNFLIYKERTKKWHDKKISTMEFQVGDNVLLYNSRLRLFLRNLKSHSSRLFIVQQVFQYGIVELHHSDKENFKVIGHRLKHYYGDSLELEERVNLVLYQQE
ncbi:uncharacterized protein LOC107261487 [Ricinus communis]|uniref:uncharacterized protein LOC107261487 n=1 Tax=Ricinus communis TaxID=3988 RepID=UPI0007729CD3|nr:uncharacterized protein LOC107261487 [Ricinus communis]|eukprot:XP_015576622.1 uncharacterized protein LOC107261487 [Ricinus communis]